MQIGLLELEAALRKTLLKLEVRTEASDIQHTRRSGAFSQPPPSTCINVLATETGWIREKKQVYHSCKRQNHQEEAVVSGSDSISRQMDKVTTLHIPTFSADRDEPSTSA